MDMFQFFSFYINDVKIGQSNSNFPCRNSCMMVGQSKGQRHRGVVPTLNIYFLSHISFRNFYKSNKKDRRVVSILYFLRLHCTSTLISIMIFKLMFQIMFLLSSLHTQAERQLNILGTQSIFTKILPYHMISYKTCTRLCVQECPEGKVIHPKYYNI